MDRSSATTTNGVREAPESAMELAPPVKVPTQQYLYTMDGILAVVSARLLGLIATLGGIGIFGYAIYEPDKIRTATAAAYALGVLWPLVYLYLRKE